MTTNWLEQQLVAIQPLGWDSIDPDLQKKALSALATVAIPFASIADTSIWKRGLAPMN
jgi:hypothetical protein